MSGGRPQPKKGNNGKQRAEPSSDDAHGLATTLAGNSEENELAGFGLKRLDSSKNTFGQERIHE